MLGIGAARGVLTIPALLEEAAGRDPGRVYLIHFVDRKKDMVRRGGENVSSQEVEHVLRGHPGIADAAVLGVADPVWGEEVKAYVVLREGESEATVPPESVRAFCAERLAPFKVPRYVEYRAELPRTASHRVRKELLRQEGQR